MEGRLRLFYLIKCAGISGRLWLTGIKSGLYTFPEICFRKSTYEPVVIKWYFCDHLTVLLEKHLFPGAHAFFHFPFITRFYYCVSFIGLIALDTLGFNTLWWNMAQTWVISPSHYAHQKLISTPPHIMIILSLSPRPFLEKKSPAIDSLIPSSLVGFFPPVRTSLQMTLRHLSFSLNNIRVLLLKLLI